MHLDLEKILSYQHRLSLRHLLGGGSQEGVAFHAGIGLHAGDIDAAWRTGRGWQRRGRGLRHYDIESRDAFDQHLGCLAPQLAHGGRGAPLRFGNARI